MIHSSSGQLPLIREESALCISEAPCLALERTVHALIDGQLTRVPPRGWPVCRVSDKLHDVGVAALHHVAESISIARISTVIHANLSTARVLTGCCIDGSRILRFQGRTVVACRQSDGANIKVDELLRLLFVRAVRCIALNHRSEILVAISASWIANRISCPRLAGCLGS